MLRFSPLIAVLAAVLIAGCGGSKRPSGTTNNSAKKSTQTLTADAYKNAACMRSHGVTSFPDPKVSSQNGHQTLSINLTPGITASPAFKSAFKACAHLMPGGQGSLSTGPSAAQRTASTKALLAFAACMRKHGFPRFPDPNSQGQLTPEMIQSAGVNLNEPALRPAADSCTSVTHGLVTKADVAQAIANPNASGSQGASSGSSGG